MKRKIREELVRISEEILADRELKKLSELYQRSRALYEKIAVLKFIEDNLNNLQVDVSKSEIGAPFETMASAVLSENTKVPETNPHQEDIITPGIDTIKHMVSEMTDDEALDEVLIRLLNKRGITTNFNKDINSITVGETTLTAPKSLNDSVIYQQISIGLNDRLAFVKYLFEENLEDYTATLSKLNGMESLAQSESYLQTDVKPKYNNWVGKEQYEARLMALIFRRFN
jgi:hypothetical protein